MKKLVIVVALMSAFGVAQAESSLAVYGVLDVGIAVDHGAYQDGSVVSVESGQQSYSRIGFKGVEDFGGGLSAFFVLEQGMQLNTGESSLSSNLNSINPISHADTQNNLGGINKGLFNSQAFLGLSSNYGSIKVGRQFSPLYETYALIDPFENGFAANINTFFGIDQFNTSYYQRMSNALSYTTPKNAYGIQANVAYSFSGIAGSMSAESEVGASLNYVNGPLTVAYAYHYANNAQTINPNQLPDAFATHFFGAAYDFGVVKIHAAFDQNKQGDAFKTQDYMVGLSVPLGAHRVLADYTYKKNNYVDNFNTSQYAIAYTYQLSKRTNLYAAYTLVDNQTNSFVNTKDENAGNSVGILQAGMRHFF